MLGSPRTPPRSVYLVALAGFPNYGDELITASWLRELAERAPQADVWVDCPHPGPAAVLLDGLHPRARFVDTVWRLCQVGPSDRPWELAAWVRHAVGDPGLAPRWAAGIDLLRAAEVIHVMGGGYIHAEWPRHIGVLAAAAAAVRLGGARAVTTGQGLVPAGADTAALLAALVEQFEVVDVRDEASAELLSAGGARRVSVTADDAFLRVGEHSASRPAPEHAGPEFMLCAQSDMLAVPPARLASVVLRTLRAWDVAPASLGIVECVPRIDRDIYALLEHELPGARFYPFAEVWRDGLPVAAGQTWLSTRFHPHLMAAAAGASGLAIAVSGDYYRTKHSSLLTLGSRWDLAGELTGDFAVPERPTAGGFPPRVLRARRAEKARLASAIYGP